MVIIKSEELQEIVELANGVPEVYREKCFELLLGHALRAAQSSNLAPPSVPLAIPQAPAPAGKLFVLPIDVKAFLSQYGLDESVPWMFFIAEGQEIRSIYKLKTTKKATAQIQHALMMTLENALSSGQFRVDIEALRSRCNDQKCYDGPNFMKNIKDKANLFKPIADDEPLSLSPDGKSELADLIEQLKS